MRLIILLIFSLVGIYCRHQMANPSYFQTKYYLRLRLFTYVSGRSLFASSVGRPNQTYDKLDNDRTKLKNVNVTISYQYLSMSQRTKNWKTNRTVSLSFFIVRRKISQCCLILYHFYVLISSKMSIIKKKKHVSKKNKKDWRKHCDIRDVEEFLEDQRLEERLG